MVPISDAMLERKIKCKKKRTDVGSGVVSYTVKKHLGNMYRSRASVGVAVTAASWHRNARARMRKTFLKYILYIRDIFLLS